MYLIGMAHVKVDYKKTKEWLAGVNRRQIPFVAAVTLTKVAQGAQKNLQRGLGTYFTLRSPRRLKAGIRIKPARKTEFKRGTMHSAVFDIDRFMALHVFGGKKTAARSKYVSIPRLDLLAQGIRTATGKVKKAKTPHSMIMKIKGQRSNVRKRKWGRHRKPRPFLQEGATGQPFIAVRQGPGRHPWTFLWGFNRMATIKSVWPFFEKAEQFAIKNSQKIFSASFKKALRKGKV